MREAERTTGAGFYFHLSADEVFLAAGVFLPTAPQMLAVRRWLAAEPEGYRQALDAALHSGIEPGLQESDPQALRRVPRGFAADHPAADLLRGKRWGVHGSTPSEAALQEDFADRVLVHFRSAAPLVTALSAAIRAANSVPPSR